MTLFEDDIPELVVSLVQQNDLSSHETDGSSKDSYFLLECCKIKEGQLQSALTKVPIFVQANVTHVLTEEALTLNQFLNDCTAERDFQAATQGVRNQQHATLLFVMKSSRGKLQLTAPFKTFSLSQ